MRIQYTLKQATVEALASRADALDIPVSRLLEYIVTDWLGSGASVLLRPAALVPQQARTEAAPVQPQHPLSTQAALTDDDEDTESCRDCAAVLPFSCFTNDGKTHLKCPSPGAGLLALRRESMGLPPA